MLLLAAIILVRINNQHYATVPKMLAGQIALAFQYRKQLVYTWYITHKLSHVASLDTSHLSYQVDSSCTSESA